MTIVRVQGNARGIVFSGSSIPVTLSSAPISGNVLVATIGVLNTAGATSTVSSITQTGVTWTEQVSHTSAYSQMENSIWFGVVGDGASTSVTVNLSGSAISGATANICEYSGILTSGFLDKTSYNDGNGGTADTGTTDTTTQAEELWIGCIIGMYGYSQGTPTNGFTLLDGFYELPISQGYLEKIVSSTGAANAGDSGIATYWGGCIATFKAAAAAGPTIKKGSIASMMPMLEELF